MCKGKSSLKSEEQNTMGVIDLFFWSHLQAYEELRLKRVVSREMVQSRRNCRILGESLEWSVWGFVLGWPVMVNTWKRASCSLFWRRVIWPKCRIISGEVHCGSVPDHRNTLFSELFTSPEPGSVWLGVCRLRQHSAASPSTPPLRMRTGWRGTCPLLSHFSSGLSALWWLQRFSCYSEKEQNAVTDLAWITGSEETPRSPTCPPWLWEIHPC